MFNYLSPPSCVIAVLNQVMLGMAMILIAKAQEITYIIATNLRYNIIHKYEKRKKIFNLTRTKRSLREKTPLYDTPSQIPTRSFAALYCQ